MSTHYYFAYGMNTNIESMQTRCPQARDLGVAELLHHRMLFKYHCDVEESKEHNAPGVLWLITDACLQSLDQLEGYPSYYNRKHAQVRHNGHTVDALVYFMQSGAEPEEPSTQYYNLVLQGYNSHGIHEKCMISGLPAYEQSV
jgi:gamma-glutamylcyclotransferase (GGCT)/AIG2-like uncharacterized protein YtfP